MCLESSPRGDAPAQGKLLVASADLADPHFARSVVLLLKHDPAAGAMGVIVNRPTSLRLGTLVPDLPGTAGVEHRLWRGGPVMPTAVIALVRSRDPLAGSEAVMDEVRVVTDRRAMLAALAGGLSAHRLRVFAGHAGWAPGQLEAELARGDWTVVQGTADTVFASRPDELWRRLGPRGLGEWTGHALRIARPPCGESASLLRYGT